MDSEVELNETIQEMHVISTLADLPCSTPTESTSCSGYTRTKTAIDISLLQELSDLESNSLDGFDSVKALFDVLCEKQIFWSLIWSGSTRRTKTRPRRCTTH